MRYLKSCALLLLFALGTKPLFSQDDPAGQMHSRGLSVPATCETGSTYFETDAKIWWTCTAANTWENLATVGSGITSLGAQTGSTQTFSKVDDTNVTLGITSATDDHAFTLGWTGILGSARGGTGNGFTLFSGPATAERTFTLPNASSTILTDNAAVTVAQGGSGAATLTGLLQGNGTSAFTVITALS